MAPRKGESADVRAARKFESAAALIQKATYDRVCAALKVHMEQLPAVERLLMSNGALGPSPSVTAMEPRLKQEVKPEVKQEVMLNVNVDTAADLAAPVQETGTMAAPVDSMNSFDKNTTKIFQVGPALLESCLSDCFPHIFTVGNMKTLRKKQAKHMPMERILEYVDLATGWDRHQSIPPEYRSQEAFLGWFVEAVENLGFRCNELVLEPRAEDQWLSGVYALGERKGNKLELRHVFLKITKKTTVPANADFEFYLTQAFSEKAASVRCHQSDFVKSCNVAFIAEIDALNAKSCKTKPANVKNAIAAKVENVGVKEEQIPASGSSEQSASGLGVVGEAPAPAPEKRPASSLGQASFQPVKRKKA